VELLLRENGIQPTSQLKPQDAALADATPDVTPARFTVLFGGHPMHERPNARARNILCVDPVVQPYAPSSPGESGVIFFAPGTILHEDDFPSFHIFLNISPQTTNGTKRSFYYLGAYCKVPSASKTVEVEEWLSLPVRVSTTSLPLPASHSLSHTQSGRLRQSHFSDFFPPWSSFSAVLHGQGASTPQRRAMCVRSMPGYPYAMGAHMGPRPRRMR
jgi:hypothetical protein